LAVFMRSLLTGVENRVLLGFDAQRP